MEGGEGRRGGDGERGGEEGMEGGEGRSGGDGERGGEGGEGECFIIETQGCLTLHTCMSSRSCPES